MVYAELLGDNLPVPCMQHGLVTICLYNVCKMFGDNLAHIVYAVEVG